MMSQQENKLYSILPHVTDGLREIADNNNLEALDVAKMFGHLIDALCCERREDQIYYWSKAIMIAYLGLEEYCNFQQKFDICNYHHTPYTKVKPYEKFNN